MNLNYFNHIGIACACLCLTSCFDLDYENYSKIKSDDFPKTETDLAAATMGAYNKLTDSYIMRYMDNSGLMTQELPTDEMNTSWTGGWQNDDRLAWTPTDGPQVNLYTYYQQAISYTTSLISAFEKSSVNDSKKKEIHCRTARVACAVCAVAL